MLTDSMTKNYRVLPAQDFGALQSSRGKAACSVEGIPAASSVLDIMLFPDSTISSLLASWSSGAEGRTARDVCPGPALHTRQLLWEEGSQKRLPA